MWLETPVPMLDLMEWTRLFCLWEKITQVTIQKTWPLFLVKICMSYWGSTLPDVIMQASFIQNPHSHQQARIFESFCHVFVACLFVYCYLSSWLIAQRQTLNIGQHALPRATFGDPGITLSAFLYESDFNLEELASNHRASHYHLKLFKVLFYLCSSTLIRLVLHSSAYVLVVFGTWLGLICH